MNSKRGRWRRVTIHATLLMVVLLAGVLVATPVSANAINWRGEYYGNMNLVGAPVVRDDLSINFDWGSGVPASGVPADGFSVRWTAWSHFGAGDYTFSVRVDDGVRMWIDDQLVLDQWKDQAATTYTFTRYMSEGSHALRVEYYEHLGDALCQVSWQSGTTPTTGWRGEYYNNNYLGGNPALVRTDASINFDWGAGSPATGINADNFSVRWTRDIQFPATGTYTFSARVDDGVRVWVDGNLIIDKWIQQSPTTHTGSVYLGAGTHAVRVEYFEAAGSALCQVSWSLSGAPPSGGTEIIVDDLDSGFIWGGPTSSFYRRSVGFRNQLRWTWNSRTQQYNWAKWFPNLPSAGNWEVYVYVASNYFGTKSARYSIYHAGTWSSKYLNQNNYYNQWVSLGSYYFNGGSSEYVFLNDVTGETYATRYVGFDAIKFVRRDGGSTTPPPSTSCSITPILGFGQIWNGNATVRAKLGCAQAVESSVWGAEQIFERGLMFWRSDTNKIYVVRNDQTWQLYDDTWREGDQEWDPNILVPTGLYQPKRGFGKVWRDQSGVRSALGWATTEERGFTMAVQPFDGGTMLWSNVRGTYVLYSDGTWARY
jgi:hypothetical protein